MQMLLYELCSEPRQRATYLRGYYFSNCKHTITCSTSHVPSQGDARPMKLGLFHARLTWHRPSYVAVRIITTKQYRTCFTSYLLYKLLALQMIILLQYIISIASYSFYVPYEFMFSSRPIFATRVFIFVFKHILFALRCCITPVQ